MATEVKLNLLMMGITGQGKSATGNTLLDKQVFKAASNTTSETKKPSFSFTQFENKGLLVVDGPGLADTDMTVAEDREAAAKNMSIALGMCYGGVDAFLFVTKYGNRFTTQDAAAVVDIKRIFGDKFMEHMIVVVTCGDQFQPNMAKEGRSISFDKWCRDQKGFFKKLYEDCGGRVVLFNNLERDEEQRRKVVEMAEKLKHRLGFYTSKCFQLAEHEREKMILEHKAPHLEEELQKTLCLLTGDIEKLVRNPSETAKASIRARVKAVKAEIKKHDRDYGVLVKLLKMVEEVEGNLNDSEQLLRLAKEIEGIRWDQVVWGLAGTVCTVAYGSLALVVPPVGLVGGVVFAAATGITEMCLHSGAKKLQQEKMELEKKMAYKK